MSTIKNLHAVYATLLAGAIIIVVGAILVNTVRYNQQEGSIVSPAPSESPTVSPSVSPSPEVVETVPEPSPTATPTVSASPTASAVFPDSAKTFLANFYAAYNQADRTRLATYFSSDTTAEDKELHATLFTGMDSQGNPGGPTLFSTNSASQRATGYSISSTAKQGNNWVVTVLEQRVDANGTAIGSVSTIVTLSPSKNTWLIDSYIRSKGVGKYSAFLTE